MKKSLNPDQRGIAHLLLILIFVAVIGIIGFAGVKVLGGKDKSTSNVVNSVAQKAANQQCMTDYNDKDLCKFLSGWSAEKKYKVESSYVEDGKTSKTTMIIDGDNNYMKTDGEFAMEIITMGDTTYTKAGNVWWKKTSKSPEPESIAATKDNFDYEIPSKDTPEAEVAKYQNLGKEACGNLTCFKYKSTSRSDSLDSDTFWFDTKDYLIRKSLNVTGGLSIESVFSYDSVSVKAPTPVKELGENQYIIPGESEPQTMPSMPTDADLQ